MSYLLRLSKDFDIFRRILRQSNKVSIVSFFQLSAGGSLWTKGVGSAGCTSFYCLHWCHPGVHSVVEFFAVHTMAEVRWSVRYSEVCSQCAFYACFDLLI